MSIKILHIIKSLGRGGAEMLLPETLKLHDKGDFEFHIIYFLPWKNQMVESIQQNGGIVTCFSARNNIMLLTQVWKVVKYIQKNKIQLVHAHLPWAGILSRAACHLAKVPLLYTEHNKQERYHFVTRVFNLLTIDMTDLVIAVSEDVRLSILRHKPKIKAQVRTLRNAINPEHFAPLTPVAIDIRKKLNIPNEALIIGTTAVFREQKRLGVWMEVARKILDKCENVHFIIVGDGPERSELLRMRQKLGLSDRLHMPGLESEIRPYLSIFDIFMMSSRFEGLPLALLEAMAMGCPVIATSAGGINEVIRHGEEGLLCDVENPHMLTEYAVRLLNDDGLRRTYGEAARSRVIDDFNLVKMVGKLQDTYRELITV